MKAKEHKLFNVLILGLLVSTLILTGCTPDNKTENPEVELTEITTAIVEPTEKVEIYHPPVWEYKIIRFEDDNNGSFSRWEGESEFDGNNGYFIDDSINSFFATKLNKLGSEGWELVGFTAEDKWGSSVMIFKRIKNVNK